MKKKTRKRLEKKKLAKKKSIKKKPAKKKPAKKPAALPAPPATRPVIEKPDVETTPWPRAGDSKEFEELLETAQPVQTPEQAAKIIKDKAAETEEPEIALKTSDVAEWVTWPFQLWSTSQNLPPIIKPNEAIEIAEPLTRILNRHNVSEKIPPDVIDGLQFAGRTIPVIKRGSVMVKLERERRAHAEPGGQPAPTSSVPQGAPTTKPIEV